MRKGDSHTSIKVSPRRNGQERSNSIEIEDRMMKIYKVSPRSKSPLKLEPVLLDQDPPLMNKDQLYTQMDEEEARKE